jgi:hypothetical protein
MDEHIWVQVCIYMLMYICVCYPGMYTLGSCTHMHWSLHAWVVAHVRDWVLGCRRAANRVKYGAVGN